MAGGLLGASSVVGQEEDEEWHSTRPDSWPSLRGTPGNNAVTSGEGPETEPEVAWIATGGPAVVADGSVYTVSDGMVRALDADDGSVQWESEDVGGDGTPAVADGTVYVGGDRLTGIETDDGEVCCAIEFDGDDDIPSPNVVNDLAFVVVDGALCAADVHNEEVEWWFEPEERLYSQAVSVSEGAVYATSEPTLFARELEDGSERWTTEAGENRIFSDPSARQDSVPVAADGVVSVGTIDTEQSGMWPEGSVALYDTETGEEQIRSETPNSHTSGPVTGGRFYARDSHNLTAYDRETGEETWEPEIITEHVESVIVERETVYAGLYIDGEGYDPDEMPEPQSGVYAFDRQSGEVEWAVETDSDDGTGPTLAFADGTIYASNDGSLWAIRAEEIETPEDDDPEEEEEEEEDEEPGDDDPEEEEEESAQEAPSLDLSVSAPDSIARGESAGFDITVWNHDDVDAEATVTLEVGDVTESSTVEIAAGDCYASYHTVPCGDLSSGANEWTVTAGEETETGTLTLEG